MSNIEIRLADFADELDRRAFLDLLDHYSRDPFGAGEPISADIAGQLPDAWSRHPGSFTLIAWQAGEPVGLANCLTSFSTFRAAPRINIHDLVVHANQRGQGLGQQMIAAVVDQARRRGACQVTLEVRMDNPRARRLYEQCGFEGLEDPPANSTHLFAKLDVESPRIL